ncbi:hypothetical protein ACJIZ3_012169 [Penstemon smallii]|uniref:Pollen Ole e 1 allergen and extensin family protein n=1 Tax=Penstemon smallii TaxID=265156 RepID=A0ABD3UMF9_9LAMI
MNRPIAIALFFFFTLAFSNPHELSQTLKGSVICLDCSTTTTTTHDYSHLSGIRVLVKCDKVKKLAVAFTEEDGTFTTQLPSDNININCMAKIMGGPYHLYTSTKNSIVKIARASNDGQLTISKPLTFFKSCPNLKAKLCTGPPKDDQGLIIGSSKTVDLPLPREWGLAPTSYYVPFFPIIGIP